jgi:hypothetical protein
MRRVTLALVVGLLALPMAAWAASTDQEVAQQIADSLRQSGRLKGYSIAVKYKDGTARLEGTVRAPQQAEQAAELANQHPDVKRVINNLSVDAAPVASRPTESRPAAPVQPLPQPQSPVVEARPASAPIQSPPASVLLARAQPQQAPLPTRQPAPAPQAASPAPHLAEQPFRQVSMPRPAENVVGRPVTAIQPQPAPTAAAAPAGLQPMPGARPIQSLLAQAPPQPIQGRMPMAARPMGQPMPYYMAQGARPMPVSYRQPANGMPPGYEGAGGPTPEYVNPGIGTAPAVYDQPYLPNYAWPSYAPYPNYAALTYPKQYSPTAWPYIGPFYPYPQVPLGWRKVTLEWDDGWWFLNFADDRRHCGHY